MAVIDTKTIAELREALEPHEREFERLPGYSGIAIGWEGDRADGEYVIDVLLEDAEVGALGGANDFPRKVHLATHSGSRDLGVRLKSIGVLSIEG